MLAQHLGDNLETVKKMFPDGVSTVVRGTSDTAKLERLIPGIEKYVGSITDIQLLKKAFDGVDTVIHIAGIHYSREIVQAAVESHVRRLILVHTTGIYSKYKSAGEEYRQIDAFIYDTCKRHGTVLTILRPTMIYGNVHDANVIKFVKMVDKLPVMPVVNGAYYELQPVHYADLGKAYYDVLMHEAETANKDFDLSGGAPIMLRDMLTEIGHCLGKKVTFVSVPYWIAYPGSWFVYLCSLGKIDLREKVQRLCEPRVYSHDTATQVFGYKPRTFYEGIKTEVEEYLGKLS